MPPEETAPVAAPVATPAPAPAATEAPAAAPADGGSGGGVAKPKESFMAAMTRLGGFGADTVASQGEEPAEAAPEGGKAEPTPEKAPKEKPKGKEPAEPAPASDPVAASAAKREQIKALATELGLEFDDSRVVSAERAEFREYKRKAREKLEKEQAELVQRGEEIVKKAHSEVEKVSAEVTRAKQIEAAAATGDYEGIAKILGHKDWAALQDHIVAQRADPNYMRLKQLETEAEERRQRERTEAEERTKREAEQREKAEREQELTKRAAAEREYLGKLSEGMKSSTDKLAQVFHDDPVVLQAVLQIQRENWDGENVIPIEKALGMGVKGAKVTLRDELKSMYERLHTVFGAPAAPPAPAPAAAKPEKPAPAPKAPKAPREEPPAQPPRVEPSTNGKRTKGEWRTYAQKRLEEAFQDE